MVERSQEPNVPLVLLVDDQPSNLVFLRRMVEAAGYRVCEAEDGLVALDMFERLQPDVVLLDLFMPLLDGFGVLRAIRKHPTLNYIPVIIITAASDQDVRQQAYNHGADDFLPKPVDSTTLQARLRVATRLKHMIWHSQQERERFAFIANISRELAHITSLHDMLEHMVNVCTATLHADQGSLILVRDREDVTEILTTSESVMMDPEHVQKVVRNGAAGHVLRTGRSLLMDNVQTSPYWMHIETSGVQRGSGLIVPIDDADGPLGTLSVYHHQVGFFTPGDQSLLESVAYQVAGLIRQAYLREEQAALAEQLSRQTRQLQLVNTLAQTLTSNLDLKTLYRVIDEQMQHLIGEVAVGWYAFGPYETTLAYSSRMDLHGEILIDASIHEALQQLIELNHTVSLALAEAPPIPLILQLIEEGHVGCMAIPLNHQSRTLGILMLAIKGRLFSDEEISLVEMARPHLAVALANAQAVADQEARHSEQAELRHLRNMAELSGQMAHHFNNLFAAILGNTQLAELDAVNEDQQALLATVVEQVRDGAAMIKRLHLLKGGDRGTSTLMLDLDEVLPGFLEHLSVTSGMPLVKTQLAPNVLVPIRERDLFILCSELLTNAFESGSDPEEVVLQAGQNSHYSYISVRDKGRGVDAKHLSSDVWRPFWTTHGPQRLGLGLPICAAIMWRIGGTITLAPNNPAPGMTATLQFPLYHGEH